MVILETVGTPSQLKLPPFGDLTFGINDECDGSNPLVGFTHELGGGFVAREGSSPSFDVLAFSVNDSTPRRTVGSDDRTVLTQCLPEAAETQCESVDNPNDGLYWSGTVSSPTEYIELGFSAGDRGATQARDVHSDDSAVGRSEVVVGANCRPHATWWSAGNVATNLNSVYAEEDHRTRAEAIRDIEGTSDLRVVGGDEDVFDGLLWLRISDVWCADSFDDIALKPAGSMQSDGYFITYAHDVNAYGHVITHGSVPGSGFSRAILLTCAADYNGDYLIDGADLAILLNAFPCTGCSEDLNGDGKVDGADLADLLTAWYSPDPEDPWVPCSIPVPSPCEESQSSSAPALTFSEALVALGFEDVAALKEWAASASPTQLNTVGAALAVLIGG